MPCNAPLSSVLGGTHAAPLLHWAALSGTCSGPDLQRIPESPLWDSCFCWILLRRTCWSYQERCRRGCWFGVSFSFSHNGCAVTSQEYKYMARPKQWHVSCQNSGEIRLACLASFCKWEEWYGLYLHHHLSENSVWVWQGTEPIIK